MRLSPARRDAFADALFEAYRTGEPAEPPVEIFTQPDGYAVQRAFADRRRTVDGPPVGYTLALASEQAGGAIGGAGPTSGRLFADSVGSPERIDTERFVAPRAVPEIAVFFGDGVPADALRAAAGDAVESLAPAIELLDSRTGSWSLAPPVAIADNALGSVLVVGPRQPLTAVPDLSTVNVVVTAGDVERRGRGHVAFGHPFDAVAWLAKEVDGLDEGTTVATGGLADPIPLVDGESIVARFDGLGTVAVEVS